jgi:hypothetical protein
MDRAAPVDGLILKTVICPPAPVLPAQRNLPSGAAASEIPELELSSDAPVLNRNPATGVRTPVPVSMVKALAALLAEFEA